jgi:hypothetical protein
MKALVLARLREPSTWRGLAVMFGAMGVGIAPEAILEIGAAVASTIAAIEIIRKEK